MNYSNESFGEFQECLRSNVSEYSLIWILRDSIFNEAFYGRHRYSDYLARLPFGWVLMLLVEWWKSYISTVHSPSVGVIAEAIILFPSSRNNHFSRLYSLYRELVGEMSVKCYTLKKNVTDEVEEKNYSSFHNATGQWSIHLHLEDFIESYQTWKEIENINGLYFNKLQRARVRIFMIQFFTWRRFWSCRLDGHVVKIVASTFEKSAATKAFYLSAMESGVAERIFWLHGLRHASLQSTLATELWCMTEGDVRHFQNIVPSYCRVSRRKSPESLEMIESIGSVSRRDISKMDRVHFLFLGPGVEDSYSKEMRRSDLEIIKKAQAFFGERISWRFRPHPACVARFKQELSEVGVEVECFSSADLREDLRWSHFVGSSWSSILLDIYDTGRPVFWVQSEIRNLGAVDELIADGIGIHIDSLSVIRKIQSLLDD